MHARQMRQSTLKRCCAPRGSPITWSCTAGLPGQPRGPLEPRILSRSPETLRAPTRFVPETLVNGHDLIALGYPPGPSFKRVLAELEDAQLEGRLHDREAALGQQGRPSSAWASSQKGSDRAEGRTSTTG